MSCSFYRTLYKNLSSRVIIIIFIGPNSKKKRQTKRNGNFCICFKLKFAQLFIIHKGEIFKERCVI